MLDGSNFSSDIHRKRKAYIMRDLSEIRVDIDRIDRQIVALFEERMALTKQVAEYKIANGKPVLDSAREAQKLDTVESLVENKENAKAARDLFEGIMAISRAQQQELIDKGF